MHLFVFIRLQHASYGSLWSRDLHNKLRVSSVKWKITTRPTHSMFLHNLILKKNVQYMFLKYSAKSVRQLT